MKRRRQTLLLGGLEILTGLGIALFWVLFFYAGLEPINPPLCYFSFEHSFFVPDVLLAALLLTGGGLLVAENPHGLMISLSSGGGLVYLGTTDVSFNLGNGIYSQGIFQTLQNAAINFWCLGFGLMMIIVLCGWTSKPNAHSSQPPQAL
jgi:hypothetical protein